MKRQIPSEILCEHQFRNKGLVDLKDWASAPEKERDNTTKNQVIVRY